MKNKLLKILNNLLYPVLSVIVIAVIWYVVALVVDLELIVPSPTKAIQEFFLLFTEKSFYSAFFSSIGRSLIAFSISALLASLLALVSMFFAPLKKFLSVPVAVTRSLPTMAVVLLLVIWTGAKTAPVVVTALVVFPSLYASFYDALSGVDKELVEVCKVCGGGKKALLLKVYLPLSAPACSLAVSANLSLSLKLTIAAEVLASTANSIGHAMQLSQIYFETARLMALTTATVIIAVVLEKVLYLILKKAFSF